METTTRHVFLLFFLFILLGRSNAQAPQAISYQAVARDNTGNILANQNISLRFNIRDATATGTVVYRETQSTTTNSLGLFSVNIGQGTVVTGTFSSIDWGGGSKFIQVEMDAAGGTTFTDMGTQKMLSVPYALNAANGNWTKTGTNITNSNSGNVGIGTPTPHASARLEVNSTTGGFLPPRMTGDQRDAIVAPQAGLMIYCTDCKSGGEIQFFNAINWSNMSGGSAGNPFGGTQLGADIDGEAASDQSGESVSLSSDGSRVAIGAALNDGSGADAGHVRIYQWNGSAWIQQGTDINGEAAGDLSGRSVFLSSDGSRVAIGATGNDGSGADAGHVRIYQWNGSAWIQQGTDINGEAAGDNSGGSVSLSSDGSRVAIGAIGNDGSGSLAGHVRIYQWNGTAWAQLGPDINGEAAIDRSGESVFLSSDGSRIAIGASLNDGNGLNAGHVRVYE